MSDLVYPPVIALAKTAFRVLDLRINLQGAEHVPTSGGAVIACNHISYLDFILSGFAAQPSKRKVRFMAKQEIFANKIAGPLMRGMHHIPVDREAGLSSYKAALEALKSGEIIGVFPEATISRSFTVKELKGGSGRMAAAAGVPLIPMALWGPQRLWTKGIPRKLYQRHIPVTILVGEPMHPSKRDKSDVVTAELHRRMQELLDRAQQEYPDKPQGEHDSWWQPAHLGGSAPAPEQAKDSSDED